MRNAVISTLLAVLEFIVAIIAGLVLVKVFPSLAGDDRLISVMLFALSVFVRKAPQIPVSDWVNKTLPPEK